MRQLSRPVRIITSQCTIKPDWQDGPIFLMEGVECKVPSTSAYNMTVAYLSYHRQHSYLWAIKLCESSAIPDVHIHYPYMDI